MATETTPSSSLMRYRPVVLAIAGFAAAYGAYIVYANLIPSTPAPAGIHRSNAVLRRPRRPNRSRQPDEAQAEAPAELVAGIPDFSMPRTYGRFDWTDGDGNEIQTDVGPDNIPTVESMLERGVPEEQARITAASIRREFTSRFILTHFQNRITRVNWEQMTLAAITWLSQRGFSTEEIREAMDQMQRILESEVTARIGAGAEVDDDAQSDSHTVAHTEVDVSTSRRNGSGLNLKQLLYHIAENQARQDGYIHRGIRCDSCGALPIRGIRWKCSNCIDLDLCTDCHTTSVHNRNHIFYEIKIPTYDMNNLHPVQEISYPGRVDMTKVPPLPVNLCKKLVESSDFEKAEIEGLYDQFTCIASSPLPGDELKYGINRQIFQAALMPLSSSSPLRPNIIFDRMFALFDQDIDGIINFEEFVVGVGFLRSRSGGKSRWKKIFAAYDIDEDGFVTRGDFLRMFRALFVLQRAITEDLLSRNEAENTLRDASAFALSGRVISSAFTQNPRTVGEPRQPLNKMRNAYGDVRDQEDQSVVKENATPTATEEEIVGHAWESHAQLPFDQRIGEPLSLRDFLYLAPRDQRGQAPSHIARDQRVRFAYDSQSVAAARATAWRERQQNREFYDDVGPAPSQIETIEVGDYEIPLYQGNSFGDLGQDVMYHVLRESFNELLDPLFKPGEDLHDEIRNARPELDRWKSEIDAYEERKKEEQEQAERAAGDPLMATAVAAEYEARQKQNGPPAATAIAIPNRGATMAETVASIEEQVQAQPLGELLDAQGFAIRETEPTAPIEGVATHLDIAAPLPQESTTPMQQLGPPRLLTSAPVLSALTPTSQPEASNNSSTNRYDPTMPQFMPNSIRDITPRDVTVDPLRPLANSPTLEGANTLHRPKFEAEIIRQFEYMFLGWERGPDGNVINGATKHTLLQREVAVQPPSEERLARLAELRVLEEKFKKRGMPERIDFEEFYGFIESVRGSDFRFLESWLEVCYF